MTNKIRELLEAMGLFAIVAGGAATLIYATWDVDKRKCDGGVCYKIVPGRITKRHLAGCDGEACYTFFGCKKSDSELNGSLEGVVKEKLLEKDDRLVLSLTSMKFSRPGEFVGRGYEIEGYEVDIFNNPEKPVRDLTRDVKVGDYVRVRFDTGEALSYVCNASSDMVQVVKRNSPEGK